MFHFAFVLSWPTALAVGASGVILFSAGGHARPVVEGARLGGLRAPPLHYIRDRLTTRCGIAFDQHVLQLLKNSHCGQTRQARQAFWGVQQAPGPGVPIVALAVIAVNGSVSVVRGGFGAALDANDRFIFDIEPKLH